MRKLLRHVAAVFVLWAAISPAEADEYVIGILTPLSGEWTGIGKAMRNGIALALEEAEDRGRFREGVRLSLKDFDDNIPAQSLGPRAEKLVRENEAILVIGPMFSTHAEVVAGYANRFEFPVLTPAVSEGVTLTGPWAFRSGMAPFRLIEGMTRGSIEYAKARTFAVVYLDANAGFQSQAQTIARVGMQMGKRLVGEIGLAAEEEAFANAAASLRTVSPDVIFVCMDAEPAAVLASRIRKLPFEKIPQIVFGPAAAQPALLEIGKEYVEGALLATDYLPELAGEQNKAFVAAYSGRFGQLPNRWAGLGYSTGLIAAEAIRNAGPSPTKAKVRDALERNTNLSLPLGQSKWNLGIRHEPFYAPAFFTIKNGTFTPASIAPPLVR